MDKGADLIPAPAPQHFLKKRNNKLKIVPEPKEDSDPAVLPPPSYA